MFLLSLKLLHLITEGRGSCRRKHVTVVSIAERFLKKSGGKNEEQTLSLLSRSQIMNVLHSEAALIVKDTWAADLFLFLIKAKTLWLSLFFKSANLQPWFTCDQSHTQPQLTECRLPRTCCAKKELCGNLGTERGLVGGIEVLVMGRREGGLAGIQHRPGLLSWLMIWVWMGLDEFGCC